MSPLWILLVIDHHQNCKSKLLHCIPDSDRCFHDSNYEVDHPQWFIVCSTSRKPEIFSKFVQIFLHTCLFIAETNNTKQKEHESRQTQKRQPAYNRKSGENLWFSTFLQWQILPCSRGYHPRKFHLKSTDPNHRMTDQKI